MNGSDKCRFHVGRRAEIVRAEYNADQDARRLLGQLGVAPVDNPLEALRDLAAEILAWQGACRAMVGALGELRSKAGAAGEQLRAEIALYERSLDRSSKVLEALVRLGIEDRLVRLSERQAVLMADALSWLLDSFGVAGNDVARAQVAAMLRAVSNGRVPARQAPVMRLVEVAGEVSA